MVRPTRDQPRHVRANLAVPVAVGALIAACSGASTPQVTPTKPVRTSVAQGLADADHAPHKVPAYTALLAALSRRCGPPQGIGELANQGATALSSAGLPDATRLAVLQELKVATDTLHKGCSGALAAYTKELDTTRPPTGASGWSGYAGSLTAFEAAHQAFPGRPGAFLPRLPNGDATYEVYSASPVTGVYRRFDPPVSQPVALAVVLRELVPGTVHAVYELRAAECQQEIYAGKQLGALTGSESTGVFVELTSGSGVGRTKYDARAVSRARLSPGGAVGGQPCT